jgi:hypothetical protein
VIGLAVESAALLREIAELPANCRWEVIDNAQLRNASNQTKTAFKRDSYGRNCEPDDRCMVSLAVAVRLHVFGAAHIEVPDIASRAAVADAMTQRAA